MRLAGICIRLIFLVVFLSPVAVLAVEPFRIRVVEEETGWPVPLVELRTTHHVRFVSDNAGTIAFDLPELMGVETWFSVEGHGYEVPRDGFGFRGVCLKPKPGAEAEVKVKRRYPGKRLGRITGGGVFGESQRFGDEMDWTDQGILGCDSVQTARYRGRLFWAWADTILPGYPLGLYHMIGATTPAQPLNSFKPPVRLRYDYYGDNAGKPRVIGEISGRGPTWISGCVGLPTKTGTEKLIGTYVKVEPPLTVHESGLCVWNDDRRIFERHRLLWTKTDENRVPPPMPGGHAVFWTDKEGRDWVLFGHTFPSLKCAKTFEAWSNPESWIELERQTSVRALDGDEDITLHRASIAWNAFRKKWVTVFTQQNGKSSTLGEMWYAEADAPTGPWGPAIKVASHNRYTFYNPLVHADWAPADTGILLFEATYTRLFSKSANPTPRYDYNQVLYRLDLKELAEMLN